MWLCVSYVHQSPNKHTFSFSFALKSKYIFEIVHKENSVSRSKSMKSRTVNQFAALIFYCHHNLFINCYELVTLISGHIREHIPEMYINPAQSPQHISSPLFGGGTHVKTITGIAITKEGNYKEEKGSNQWLKGKTQPYSWFPRGK